MFCKLADSDSLVERNTSNKRKEWIFRQRNEDVSTLLMRRVSFDAENYFNFDNENHPMITKNPALSLNKGASLVERLFVHANFWVSWVASAWQLRFVNRQIAICWRGRQSTDAVVMLRLSSYSWCVGIALFVPSCRHSDFAEFSTQQCINAPRNHQKLMYY